MKILLTLLLLTGFCLAEVPLYQQIIAGKQVGPVTATSTHKDIAAIVGTAYLEEGEVYVGEGQSVPATVIFPGHPNRMLKVIWKSGPRATAHPDSVWIMGSESEWSTASGVSLGTKLTQLERLNGEPFRLLGFEWDLGGAVTEWGGKLESELDGIHIRLALPENAFEVVGEDGFNGLIGDREIPSTQPGLQTLNPTIDRIVVTF